MLKASEVRNGMCLMFGGDLCKVVLAEMKVGTAKLPSSVHLRLRNLRTGSQSEQRLMPEAKVEDVVVETVQLEYSYKDADTAYFMHPETYEQVGLPKRMLGLYERFLVDGARVKVEFFGEEAIDAVLPETAEAVVASTAAPIHDPDAAPKSALLANGLEVQVPQFVKTGDRVRLDVASGTYLERLQ
ncbi:hypothetical protein FJY71_02515 [candidate division WOR-3 bacterium]|nr:hypothetical protein [candidate division WOR-3 bacterium]